MPVPEDALADVAEFCEQRTPTDLRDQLRLECSTRGNAITIVERRAPWNPAFGTDWTTSAIAQLRWDTAQGTWALYWRGSDERWHEYEGIGTHRETTPLLDEIDADPTGIFWG
jgi:hypothetical protein